MKRLIDETLKDWKHADRRKPIILRGARQVGKTHTVRRFGELFDHYVEINLEILEEAHRIFEGTLDPELLVRDLKILTGKDITPGKTLLFIDEIQMMPRAIIALRYFYEEMPELHVIAAGSLINFAIEKVGVPVGRVSFLHMFPLSFIEFVHAIEGELLVEALLNYDIKSPFHSVIHDKALKLLGEYIAIGGMPEAVASWRDQQDLKTCQHIHHDLLASYKQDFGKYAKTSQLKYLDVLFDKCPRLIGQRFKYSNVSTSYRKRELEPCLELLIKTGIIHQVQYSAGNGLPLGGEMAFEKFKLLFLDTGLTQAALNLDLKDWFLNPDSALSNKGAIVEAFVGQEMLAYADFHTQANLYFWHRESRSSSAEVDYLAQINGHVIPIEVKAGKSAKLKSLQLFLDKRPNSPYGLHFSPQNAKLGEHIHAYPLYAVFAALRGTRNLKTEK